MTAITTSPAPGVDRFNLAAGHYVIFDGPPGPESGRFVELETEAGKDVGSRTSGADWHQLDRGMWALGPFKPTATVNPDLGVVIRHDSAVESQVENFCTGPGANVSLDGEQIAGPMSRSDADDLVTDIEKAIRHAQLVHGIRQLADFIEQRPALAELTVTAGTYLYGTDAREYRENDGDHLFTISRDLDGGAKLSASAGRDAVCSPAVVDGKVMWMAPDLGGRRIDGDGS